MWSPMTIGDESQSSFHFTGCTDSLSSVHSTSAAPGRSRATTRRRLSREPGVDERVALGIDGGRALDQVAGLDVGEDPLPGVDVHEVEVAVVATEDRPRAVLPLDDGGLAGPPHAAPHLGDAEVGGLLAHRRVGELVRTIAGAVRGTGPTP